MAEQIGWMIPLFPLAAAMWIAVGYVFGLNRGESGEKHTAMAATAGAAISLALLLVIGVTALFSGIPGEVVNGEWLRSGEYSIHLILQLDTLSLTFGIIVALIALMTIRFSVNYLHREEGFQRFFMILSLFTTAMLLIILAGNAVLAFIGWELAGVSSYLLIAYSWERPVATENATWAFVTNRIGDAGFILGLFLLFYWFGGTSWSIVGENAPDLSILDADLLALGFVIAALAKSGQLPFTSWVARALEGPTPSSAVFYGSLMIHAGVYLVIRLAPVLEQAPAIMWLLVVVGALTAIYGWLGGLVQTDVKSSLMFSTTGQVGLMFVSCGLGLFELAAVHMSLHAIFRLWQFLNSPALMHQVHSPLRPAPFWLHRRTRLYTAVLERFWLDHLAKWLLVRPTIQIGNELLDFDEKVVRRIAGSPDEAGATALNREQRWLANLGRGRGVFGSAMEVLAKIFEWFEEHLVLQGAGEGLMNTINHLGRYVQRIDQLLSQPRYLFLLIMATFVVVI